MGLPGRRSIPAHAGEPAASGASSNSVEVYPRPRGGTASSERLHRRFQGLSPPTRGNQSPVKPRRAGKRSIPAHAGEPCAQSHVRAIIRVYPRPRGGTSGKGARTNPEEGLSPPTRGNQSCQAVGARRRGSIPAHAGEPESEPKPALVDRVYPRPRGGTRLPRQTPALNRGLSPPTRGNLALKATSAPSFGSIPAHAGEPTHGV